MWGALPTYLLQAAGGLPFMVPIIDAALNTINCTELETSVHIRDIIRRLKKKSREKPILFEPHNPILEEKEFQCDVNRVITSCNIHEHTETCLKPQSDYCRMARPQPIIDETRCVQIIYAPETPEHREKYIVLPEVEPPQKETTAERNVELNPIVERDDRTLIWEMKRSRNVLPILCTTEQDGKTSGLDFLKLPNDLQSEFDLLPRDTREYVNRTLEKRNGIVIEYNKIASSILGCNTDVSLLGSDSQAKLALCYILVYMVKPSAPLAKSISLILNARQEMEKHPSIATDSETPKRTAMHLLNKILNNISGLQEISAQTAAACILGMPSTTCTHEFQLVFVDTALHFLDELDEETFSKYEYETINQI